MEVGKSEVKKLQDDGLAKKEVRDNFDKAMEIVNIFWKEDSKSPCNVDIRKADAICEEAWMQGKWNEGNNKTSVEFQENMSRVDELFTHGGKEDEISTEWLKNAIGKVKEIARYVTPVEMIKTVAYFTSLIVEREMDFSRDIIESIFDVRLENKYTDTVFEIYKDAITPEYIKQHLANENVDKDSLVNQFADVTLKTVETYCYLKHKLITGVYGVAEDVLSFAIGTIVDLSGNRELAEKVYKADVTGKIADKLNESYSGFEFGIAVGECTERIGHDGTYIALSMLASYLSVVPLLAVSVGIGMGRAGESIRNDVRESGEYNTNELLDGVVKGTVSAITVLAQDKLSSAMDEVGSKLLQSIKVENKVVAYLLGKTVSFLKGTLREASGTAVNEFTRVGYDNICSAINGDYDNVDWKSSLKAIGKGALIGGTIAVGGEIIEDVVYYVGERMHLAELKKTYINDLKVNSECSDTIKDNLIDLDRLKKRTPEETKKLRNEFATTKDKLIEEWEKRTGKKWPVYSKDVYNEYGEIVKKAGWKYDAHHIHPLSLGGENIPENITPLRYDIHSDHKGVHAKGSPYDVLDRYLKERKL